MEIERRRFSRSPFHANAVLVTAAREHPVTLVDISEHGVLVQQKERVDIDIGDQIKLRVLTENGGGTFEASALVVRRADQHIALEISKLIPVAELTKRH